MVEVQLTEVHGKIPGMLESGINRAIEASELDLAGAAAGAGSQFNLAALLRYALRGRSPLPLRPSDASPAANFPAHDICQLLTSAVAIVQITSG